MVRNVGCTISPHRKNADTYRDYRDYHESAPWVIFIAPSQKPTSTQTIEQYFLAYEPISRDLISIAGRRQYVPDDNYNDSHC